VLGMEESDPAKKILQQTTSGKQQLRWHFELGEDVTLFGCRNSTINMQRRKLIAKVVLYIYYTGRTVQIFISNFILYQCCMFICYLLYFLYHRINLFFPHKSRSYSSVDRSTLCCLTKRNTCTGVRCRAVKVHLRH
jgi:hypothetical protein